MNWLILITGIIALLFAGSVFERYRERGGAHLLAWSLGAVFYGLAALGEAIVSVGFNEIAMKTWYLGGAMLTAAWLGQGTIYLLLRKRMVAPIIGALLLLFSLIAIQFVIATPVDLSNGFDASLPLSENYKDVLSRDGFTVALTIILNIYGTLALAGGAIYSSYIFWRKRTLKHRAIGNVLIAVGAILPASGGTSVLVGIANWHNLSLFLGVIFLYLGYLVSTPSNIKD
jgi:hypothetical protein